MTNDRTKWEPTENMMSFVRYLKERDYDSTVTAACKEVGIARESYYDWFDNPTFRDWWQDEIDRHFALRRGRVLGALFKGATSDNAPGNPTDRRLFLERYDVGYAPKRRETIEHTGAMDIDLSSKTQEQLERMAHAGRIEDDAERELERIVHSTGSRT